MYWKLLATGALIAALCACSGEQGETSSQAPASVDAGPQMQAAGPAPSSALAPRMQQASAPLPPGTYRMRKVEIMDAKGFGRPLVAATILIPEGWNTEGGMEWGARSSCTDPFGFNWAATSPDGVKRFELGRGDGWQWASFGPVDAATCKQASYSSAREYLTAYVQARFPDARILDYRERPEFSKAAADMMAQVSQMAAERSIPMRGRADGGELLFAFTLNGREMRGTSAVTASFYESQHENPMGGAPLRTITGSTTGVFNAFAPNGELDFQLAEAVRKSTKPEPEWFEEISKFKAKLAGISLEAQRQRASIIIAGGAALSAITIQAGKDMVARGAARMNEDLAGTEAFNQRMAAEDRMQRERIEALTEVETYNDPVTGGTVQLDNTYDHAWRVTNSTSDTYILTNDPNFNPGLYGVEASEMAVTQ